jgi:hypothetical protein
MNKKVIRMPIKAYQRWKNFVGKYGVPCMISNRWLSFPEESAGHFQAGESIRIDVMTLDSNEKPRRLCELVVTREDLVRVINMVKEK